MRGLFISIGSLICAIAVFICSAAAASGAMPVISASASFQSDAQPQTEQPQTEQPQTEQPQTEQPSASAGSYLDFEGGSEVLNEDFFITDLMNEGAPIYVSTAFPQDFNPFPDFTEPVSSRAASSGSGAVSDLSKPVSSETSKPASSVNTSSENESSETPSDEMSAQEESSEEETEPQGGSGSYDEDFIYQLAGAVQREIVGVNTNPNPNYYEAYKAQAVASHCYMEYYLQHSGSYPSMSFTTPKQATIDLVREVADELMYYNGSVINASYHAAAGGYTQSAVYVWGGNIGYLVGVESANDDYNSTSTLSVSTVEQRLSAAGISVSGDPSSWFDLSGASLTDGGFVDYISICGTMVKGRTLRENILGTSALRSNKITDISVSGDTFVFQTKGYGHGVGMSQQGALGYSAMGWGYRDILAHYYTGISIQ